jgi:hypothetical protein
LYRRKKWPNNWRYFCNFQKVATQSKQPSDGQKFGHSGHPVAAAEGGTTKTNFQCFSFIRGASLMIATDAVISKGPEQGCQIFFSSYNMPERGKKYAK